VLAGGEAKEAGQMCAALEALDITNFAYQCQGIADTGSGGIAEQGGFWSVFDQSGSGLVEVGFAFLASGDVVDEMVDALTDLVSSDGTGEGVAAAGDETFGVLVVESRATVGFQDAANRLYTGIQALIGEDVLLEQGVNGLVVELGARKNVADGWIVGPHQGAQLILLAVDLSSQVASGSGAETGREQVSVLGQDNLWGAPQADLLGQGVGIDEFVAHLLGEDFGHMRGGTRIVEHTGQVGALGQKVPTGPVVHARGLHGQEDDAQTVPGAEVFQPIPGLLETWRIVGRTQMTQFITGSIASEQGEDVISHVATDIHRQTVEIGLEQVLHVNPRYSRGQVGLQFSAEGLAKGKQFAIHVAPPRDEI